MSKFRYCLKKILHKVFFFLKIFKFLAGLVGFGNLRFAEIKSCPSTYPTCDLRKAEIPQSLKKNKGMKTR